MVNRLAVHEFQGHFRNLRSKQWIAFNICVEPSIDHGLETTTCAVEGDDLEIARLDTGCLQSFDGAKAHIVVLNFNALEINAGFVFLQEGLHYGNSFCTGKVAGLGIQDLDVGIQVIFEAFRAANGCTGTGGARQFEDRRRHRAAAYSFQGQLVCLPTPYRSQYGLHTGMHRR